ncbi:hypothetical protein TPHA_0P00450 [Tetrapisispora phaffii CBS 4417]|uniref:Aminopeptidase P N-terminal domain-containing protein n=1 Tax=Tetrapisispora phaffii (strain ATCC 24235 / CBS 4417 / NBRC 1672 / NRRL Y-8282 / UCD 70-5) TaxID=1071381 RepID=G8C225_TETPH|nr:hypothetical protein TPHA_0P00450 [Tetrapisispora phaffii CBS 4417]CCE66203.1 hypothetical protein TPHA_0P00450 [Tetrapisispora phaffii CBS 4417]
MGLVFLSSWIVSILVTYQIFKKKNKYQFGRSNSLPYTEEKMSYPVEKQFKNFEDLADPNYVPEKLRGKKYLAKEHCLRVKKLLLSKVKSLNASKTGIFIAGEEMKGVKYCDAFKDFRQNQYFYYLSGVYDIPGCSLFFDFHDDSLTLFLPNVDTEDIMWSGEPLYPEEALKKYDADAVKYYSDLESEIINNTKYSDYLIFTTDLDNVHIDALAKKLTPKDKDFFFAMDETRVIKDWYEIEIIRRACEISDKSHLAVMSALPIELNELHIQAEFKYHATRQGGRTLGYDPICCSGPACGTLHYIKNDEDVHGKVSTLIDCGAEWRGYTSDVTRCFPLSGKFTKEHRDIYETVLDMQSQAMELIKPGAEWDDLHFLTHRVLIQHFLKLGIFKKEFSEEELIKRRVSAAFYPHGLGHMLGIDVHDVAGNANYEDPDPYFCYLRIRRRLEENMVVTNEPGCYFNEHLIKNFLKSHSERLETVNMDVVAKYMHVGGVRIEDDILVTAKGYENLNKVTSDPDEIEKIVSAGLAKGRSSFHVLA